MLDSYLHVRLCGVLSNTTSTLGYLLVERLTVHLPGLNHIRYEPSADLRALLDSPAAKSTMLTGWFEANSKYIEVRHLTYCDFPKEWSWDASKRC
jgi:hypothetical protein